MNLRTKLIIVFAALALLPLAVVCLLQYRAGAGAVESLLRERSADRADRVAGGVEHILSAQQRRLTELAQSEPLRAYAQRRAPASAASNTPSASAATQDSGADVPQAVRDRFNAYFAAAGRDYLQAVTYLDRPGTPALRVKASEGGGLVFQTSDFMTNEVRCDPSVWERRSAEALRSGIIQESYGASLRITAPVGDPKPLTFDNYPAGAVVAEFRLSGLLRDADGAESAAGPPARRSILALDNATDNVVYHTNEALRHQTAGAMPYFAEVAARMKAGGSGSGFYETAEGGTQLASFRQVEGLGLSVAASEDYAGALAPVRRAALWGGALALLAAAAGAVLFSLIAARETRGINLVARRASAVAAGDLEQRIEVSHSGETRELAENFNAMTERLRELIAREAESRQFASFMRISAMVSHDLKNAIAGLSMLVSNMEKQFHREEFRADAIDSLREATEKLKRTVARLSEPAKSLSGEYRIASRPTDLVPIMRRVLATNAEPTRPLNDIEARLPDKLVVTVEPERVENVIENLVINALEAMGAKGGRLTVEAGKLDGDYVFFSVADTGVGMTKEFIKTRLYRPFSTTKNKGIGLGLFTVKEVVEAHGGKLEVESSPGAGTRFRVVLPSRLFQSGERRERPWKAAAATTTESALPNSSG
ncbi:MAG TPA: ATP-binding protein [Pyrinomonadaceae bacterium]